MTCQQPFASSVFDLSKSSGGSSAEGAEGEEFGEEVSPPHRGRGNAPSPPGQGAMPPPQKVFFPFQNSAFWCVFAQATNSKVLFVSKCRERYVITVFLATDGDTDMKVFINLVNFSPSSQSIATRVGFTATVGMCYRPEIILHSEP